jgi:excinuclease ABC subunit B
MVQTEETFRLSTNLKPAGDQPKAIEELLDNLLRGVKDQVLLGATGTGKTFTIANVIAKYGKPTLIIAHNKILAAQLYRELKELFPHNRVEYFISYYDYYQPEAYIPEKDLYIEKDASINEILERYRHSATISVLERRDVIVVASVSCIYGLGSPHSYYSMRIPLEVGKRISQSKLARMLVEIGYERNDYSIKRATFSFRGSALEIIPSDMEDQIIRVEFWDDEIESISLLECLQQKQAKGTPKGGALSRVPLHSTTGDHRICLGADREGPAREGKVVQGSGKNCRSPKALSENYARYGNDQRTWTLQGNRELLQIF